MDGINDTKILKELYVTHYPMFFEKYLNDVSEYGNRVRNKRKSVNLTVRQLSQKLGISHSELSKIENGNKTFINLDILQMLSEILDCSIFFLLAKSDFEKGKLENYCYTNPYNNQELIEAWCTNLEHSTCRKIFADGKEFEMPDFRIRTLIDIAKENPDGIKLHIDDRIYYLMYLTKKYYVKSTPLRKEKYIEYKTAIFEKNNKIREKLPNDSVEFFRYKEFKDCLIIQNCSPVQWLAEKVTNADINVLYHQKLTEIFQKGFMQYTNYNLIDYLFELHEVNQFNEDSIIQIFTRILHTSEIDHSSICKLINKLLYLPRKDIDDLIDKVDELLKGSKGCQVTAMTPL